MKKLKIAPVSIIAVFLGVLLCACSAGKGRTAKNGEGLSVAGRWVLREVRTPEASVTLERPALAVDGDGEAYTLYFDGEESVHGIAAFSPYSGPCGWGDDFTIAIGPLSATEQRTREMPFLEETFFSCLEQINRWAFSEEGIELYNTGTDSGRWLTMSFGRY